MGDRRAKKFRELAAAAGLTGGGFLAPDQKFLFFMAITADEIVERHWLNLRAA